jgi:hypothetical protein
MKTFIRHRFARDVPAASEIAATLSRIPLICA